MKMPTSPHFSILKNHFKIVRTAVDMTLKYLVCPNGTPRVVIAGCHGRYLYEDEPIPSKIRMT